MFGRNDFVENVKSALAAVDCDMGAFRSWQKMYDKLKKKKSEQEDRYRRCREQTKRVQEDAQLMEHMLTTAQSVDGKEFGRLLKDLRQMQNSFDHEFLVSKEDQEFHSTYDTILRLGTKALNAPDQKLLLQSEIENLLALLKENLEKEEPEIAALTFYYQLDRIRNSRSCRRRRSCRKLHIYMNVSSGSYPAAFGIWYFQCQAAETYI